MTDSNTTMLENAERWQNQSVLITGVCGTIGQGLLRHVVDAGAREVTGIDNNESGMFFLTEQYRDDSHVRLAVGDIADRDTMYHHMRGVTVVLHAAALKHVTLCEQSPVAAVNTNIDGTQNIINAALELGVRRVLFTSSDKAVNPTNVMGTSKLMGERLITAANASRRGSTPVLASTRFGNVLGSRGSVIPVFRQQIAAGGPVTLTHPDMTRFVMTRDEAVRLVMDSTWMARGGEVFVTKMPVIRIEDLAHVMVAELSERFGHDPADVEVRVIGSKPGEKMYEELVSGEESMRSIELERYFAVIPAFRSVYHDISYDYPGIVEGGGHTDYVSRSDMAMSRDDLRRYLVENRLLEEDPSCAY